MNTFLTILIVALYVIAVVGIVFLIVRYLLKRNKIERERHDVICTYLNAISLYLEKNDKRESKKDSLQKQHKC